MSNNITALRTAINSLPEPSTQPTATFSTNLPKDASWAPLVPIGHTAYTWTGKDIYVPNESSVLLGSVRASDVPAGPKPQLIMSTPEPLQPVIQEAPVKKETAKNEEKKMAQKINKAKQTAAVTTPIDLSVPSIEALSQLDFVVGKIVECKKHDNADSLYVEQIDVGADRNGKRQIVSGLVKYLSLEEMIGSMCIVVANLKPAPLRGEISNGMVLAASDPERTRVVLCQPPAGAQPGDRIIPVMDGIDFPAPAAEINPKKKNNVWAIIAPELKTNEKGELVFGEHVLGTSNGPATASITNAIVS